MTHSTTTSVILVHVLAVLLLSLYGHGHGGSRDFNDPRNVHNEEHIKEHMSDYYKEDDLDEQVKLDTDEDKEFYYFKLHDYDHNNKLDGLEITAAMLHHDQHHASDGNDADNAEAVNDINEDDVKDVIKRFMDSDDLNEDGFIDYYEFKLAQKKRMEEYYEKSKKQD